jgi:hypothetical protein
MDIARMDHQQRMRLRAAAFQATLVYPGPVGELLRRELMDWEEFGYRFGGGAFIERLIDHVSSASVAPGEAA